MIGKPPQPSKALGDVGSMLDGISAVLGALVAVTPFLRLDTGNDLAMLSATGCGFAIMGLAFLDGPEPEPWTRWVSGLMGAWVAVSPWILQRALVPLDSALAPPMADPAVAMPVVLGLAIVVTAARHLTRTAMDGRRSLPAAAAEKRTGCPVPALALSVERPIPPSEA